MFILSGFESNMRYNEVSAKYGLLVVAWVRFLSGKPDELGLNTLVKELLFSFVMPLSGEEKTATSA